MVFALIPLFVVAVLAFVVTVVVVGGAALFFIILFLVKHPRLGRIVLVAAIVVAAVLVAEKAGRNLAVDYWPKVQPRLALRAEQVDPHSDRFSSFSNYAAYAPGYENYISMTGMERDKFEVERQLALAGLPLETHFGYRPGSKQFDRPLMVRQMALFAKVSDDESLTPLRGAAWRAVIEDQDSPSIRSPGYYSEFGDVGKARKFLARLAKQGNRQAAHDLALLETKSLLSLRDNSESACRQRLGQDFQFDDDQCDLYDPRVGQGFYPSLYRKWSSLER